MKELADVSRLPVFSVVLSDQGFETVDNIC